MKKGIEEFGLLTLPEIFNNRLFVIPDYQRGYSWEKTQVQDLLHDIDNLAPNSHKHFTGTLVASRRPDGKFDIVDGQQRLTTLIILLSEIYRTAPNSFPELKEKYLYRGTVGNQQSVLKTNEETWLFFEQKVLNGKNPGPEIRSHNRICDALEEIAKWVKVNKKNLVAKLEVIEKHLGFILFLPQNDKEIGIMFETINNRGKPLSELEKIKNYLIYFATIHEKNSLHELINKQWPVLQKNLSVAGTISNEDEDKFLRYTYLVFEEVSKKDSYFVYKQVKAKFPGKATSPEMVDAATIFMIDFVNFITDCSLYPRLRNRLLKRS
jgi:uncharacterized protein with ParB-like and HNH nuclease domain